MSASATEGGHKRLSCMGHRVVLSWSSVSPTRSIKLVLRQRLNAR